MDLVDVGRHEGFSEIHLVHFHLKSINYTRSKSWPQRLSSHRGPGWSRSWRRGSRRPVSERWATPRCGGLWSDTGPASAADLCSSGTESLRWATAASPVSDTQKSWCQLYSFYYCKFVCDCFWLPWKQPSWKGLRWHRVLITLIPNKGYLNPRGYFCCFQGVCGEIVQQRN